MAVKQSIALTDLTTSRATKNKGARFTAKKERAPQVIPGEPNLYFAPSDLPASPLQSTTTDSVDW